MDELTIDGKVYVSSKRAAALSGYAKDYIGQLCREGRVDSKLVGRSWYVYEPSIREHRFADERSKAKGEPEKSAESTVESSEKTNIQAVWEHPSYTPEPFEPLPAVQEIAHESAPVVEEGTHTEAPSAALSEMQSAWQDWFSTQKGEETTVEAASVDEHQSPLPEEDFIEEEVPLTRTYEDTQEAEEVPVRMIVSDIEPIRAYKTVEAPMYSRTETTTTQRREVREERVPASKVKRAHKRQNREENTSAIPVKALLIAFIVLVLSVAFISTGVIDQLHLTSSSDFGILQFLQGNTVVDK